MQILIAFITLVLHIIFYFRIISKTENTGSTGSTENIENTEKGSINRKKHKGDL